MLHTLAARQGINGVTVLRPHENHYAGKPTAEQMLSKLLAVHGVVSVRCPRHGGALRAVTFQGVGQIGGKNVCDGGGADQ
jgi:hypothetical protein